MINSTAYHCGRMLLRMIFSCRLCAAIVVLTEDYLIPVVVHVLVLSFLLLLIAGLDSYVCLVLTFTPTAEYLTAIRFSGRTIMFLLSSKIGMNPRHPTRQ